MKVADIVRGVEMFVPEVTVSCRCVFQLYSGFSTGAWDGAIAKATGVSTFSMASIIFLLDVSPNLAVLPFQT